MTPVEEKAKFAIIGWQSDSTRLALHPIKNGQMRAQIPFSKESAKNIFSVFEEYQHIPKHFKGMIPRNVLLAKDINGEELQIAWTNQAQKRMLSFNDEDLNKKEFHLPNLLFKLYGTTLHVYAFKGKEKEQTLLYIAPFYNIYENASVCMGNVSLKNIRKLETFDAVIKMVEDSFYKSQFTHSNNNEISKSYIASFLTPNGVLKPINQTIESNLTRWN